MNSKLRIPLCWKDNLDVIGRALPRAATKPSTNPTSKPVTPTTQPVDVQLEAAVSTMIGHIILDGKRPGSGKIATPMTAPSTQPAL